MTIQEILNSSLIKEVEEEIIDLQWKIEHRCGSYESQKEFIRRLLEIRKRLLNHEFVMDEHYRQLLEEFNAAMREQGAEDKVIQYTDVVGTLMTSVTRIINMLSLIHI